MCYCGIHYTQHLPPCWTLKPDVMNEGMHDHVVVPCHAPKHISDDFLGYTMCSHQSLCMACSCAKSLQTEVNLNSAANRALDCTSEGLKAFVL